MNLEQALTEYRRHFGSNYPLMRTSTATTEQVIQDILIRIKEDRPAKRTEYAKNRRY